VVTEGPARPNQAGLWRILAAVAICLTVHRPGLVLASPNSGARVGPGRISGLMDRSRSMDAHMPPAIGRKIDRSPPHPITWRVVGQSQGARDLLSKFVAERPDDGFGLMSSARSPLSVVSSPNTTKSCRQNHSRRHRPRPRLTPSGSRADGIDRRVRSAHRNAAARIILLVSRNAAPTWMRKRT